MINQMLKLGALIATGRFLKQRIRGLLGILLVWLVLWFTHSEFVSYVELSGDTRYVLHASIVKLLLYALSIGIYVWRVERPLWPKPVPVADIPVVAKGNKNSKPSAPGTAPARIPAGDDGFNFLRDKKKLHSPAELLKGQKEGR